MQAKIQALDQAHKAAWSAYYDAKGRFDHSEKSGAADLALYKDMQAAKGAWHEAGTALRDELRKEG